MSELLSTAKDNLSFVIVCLLVVAAIFLIAAAAQKFLCRDLSRTSKAKTVAFTAVFSAVGGALMLLEIPLFFAPSFYKIDLSELPVLLCAFYLGPTAGVTAEFLKVVIKLLLKGSSTAFVGDFSNFVVGCTFILPASVIYHCSRTKKTAVVGMIFGTLIMTALGSFFNAVYLVPKFAEMFHMELDAIVGMGTAVNSHITDLTTLILFAVVPFNLLKGSVDSVLTFFLYKRLERVFFRERRGGKKKK